MGKGIRRVELALGKGKEWARGLLTEPKKCRPAVAFDGQGETDGTLRKDYSDSDRCHSAISGLRFADVGVGASLPMSKYVG